MIELIDWASKRGVKSDPVSGNLNAAVSQGYLIKNGELTQPIKGMVISANFYELIKNQIELVGNDLNNSMQYYSPSVKLKELTVVGEN
jgi:predicted Zn-dependent protease